MATDMATTSTPAPLPVPGLATLPQGLAFYVYDKGIDAFERYRINGDVALALDDGTTATGKVMDLRVGALIDLLVGTGPQAAMMVSRIYSPLALVQALTETSDTVLDVTKIYTAIAVQVPVRGQA